MTVPTEEPRPVFYQAFVRDGARCVYCDRDIMESYDSFAASCLDHLKPKSRGGPCNDPWNRVTSCVVCNNLKGAFDPTDDCLVTPDNFAGCVDRAREYVREKRQGVRANSYFRDYEDWKKILKSA